MKKKLEDLLILLKNVSDPDYENGNTLWDAGLTKELLEKNPVGIVILNELGDIVFSNEKAESILAISKQYLISQTYNSPVFRITDYDGNPIPDDELPFSVILRTKSPLINVKHAIQPTDNERKLLKISGAPIFNREKQITCVILAIEDMTGSVLADRAIKESEEKFRNLFEFSGEGIIISDLATGMVLDANNSILNSLGYTKEELQAFTLEDFSEPMTEKERELLFTPLNNMESILYEHVFIRKNGTKFPVEVSSKSYCYSGKCVVQSFVRDITEKRQLEQAKLYEMETLQAMSGPVGINITAESFGQMPLKKAMPELFFELTLQLSDIIHNSLEKQLYKSKTDKRISDSLYSMAEQLGKLRSGPRDVLDIHVNTLKMLCKNTSDKKSRAYQDEGRLVLIELLGNLVSYYRNHLPGSAR